MFAHWRARRTVGIRPRPEYSPRPWSTVARIRVLYLVLERYLRGPGPVYERLAERGRMLPAGLVYIESWVTLPDHDRCFQLMEAAAPSLLEEWMSGWADLVEFEVTAVVPSAEVAPPI